MGNKLSNEERNRRETIKHNEILYQIQTINKNSLIENSLIETNYVKCSQLQRGGQQFIKNDYIAILLKLTNDNSTNGLIKYSTYSVNDLRSEIRIRIYGIFEKDEVFKSKGTSEKQINVSEYVKPKNNKLIHMSVKQNGGALIK